MLITIINNVATFAGKHYPICHGENGYTFSKVEGDGKTPIGSFNLREMYFRQDKIKLPSTKLKVFPLSIQDGWCDDPSSNCYNQHVKLPIKSSHEKLWREDSIYDLIVVIGYNDDPILKGKGSAIFIHLARENKTPTKGCIAFEKSDLLEILPHLNENSRIEILNPSLP